MKIPRPLQLGDGIAIVNPAGILPERFRNQQGYIKVYLEQLGFVVKDYTIEKDWENPINRSEALLAAFTDQQVKAVLPLCGGKKIYDVLPLIDYDVLANHPKIICGSSELSALMIMIAEKANMVTFFGPHLNFLNPKASKLENQFTVRSFWNMLQWDWHGKNNLNKNEAYHFFAVPRTPMFPIRIPNIYCDPMRIADKRYRDNFYHVLNPKQNVDGSLLIGSLSIFVRLCEEGFVPAVADKIIVLDSLDMSLGTILKLFQKFNTYCNLSCAAAIVFSSLAERTDRDTLLFPELRDLDRVKNFLEEISMFLGGKIPIFHGFPIGHCAYKLTLPIGVSISIVAENGDLLLMESPYQY